MRAGDPPAIVIDSDQLAKMKQSLLSVGDVDSGPISIVIANEFAKRSSPTADKEPFIGESLMTSPPFTQAPNVETPRLRLRAFRADDAEPFCAQMADDEFATFITKEGRGLSYGESWSRFCGLAGHWVARGYGNFAVEEKDGGAFIGHVGPMEPPGWPAFEIGWGIFPRYQGKGYATEAAAAAFLWSHTMLGRQETLHMIADDNEASQKVARALGAEPEEMWTPFWPDAKPVRKWRTRWEAFAASPAYARLVG